MKKRMGVLIFLFLTGMILGTMQPAMLYAGEVLGNPWDQLLDTGPYLGIWLKGPLSIYYEFAYDETGEPIICSGTGDVFAYMYYTVRLNKELDIRPNPDLYTFQGTNGSCLNNWEEQATIIREFLGTVVVPGIFPNAQSWKWKVKSIKKAQYHDDADSNSRAFVADIEIAVIRGR